MSDTTAIVAYETVGKAQDAFLDAYFGDANFDRDRAAELSGVMPTAVADWFETGGIVTQIEKRLQTRAAQKSNLQETLLDQAAFIMEGNIADLFDMSENGNLLIKNIKTLPRHISACVKQMDIIRTQVPGSGARPEYTEALRIVMHDKTKVMNIIGDYTDVKNTALKRADSGAPKMVGMSLVLSAPESSEERKELGDGTGDVREVQDDEEAEGERTGDSGPIGS